MASFFSKSGAKVTRDGMADLKRALKALSRREVLVGVPEDKTIRDDGAVLTNAGIAYIQDNGAPEDNIPARPFMRPGIDAARDKLIRQLAATAKAVLNRGANPDDGLTAVGLTAVSSIKMQIKAGIPPPLADATVAARANRKGGPRGGTRRGAQWEMAWRAAGAPPGLELAKPLIDTANMIGAISYVLRDRSKRAA